MTPDEALVFLRPEGGMVIEDEEPHCRCRRRASAVQCRPRESAAASPAVHVEQAWQTDLPSARRGPRMKLLTEYEAAQLAAKLGYQISPGGIRTAGYCGRLAVARITEDESGWYAEEEIERYITHRLTSSRAASK